MSNYYNNNMIKTIAIPQGYRLMSRVELDNSNIDSSDQDNVVFCVQSSDEHGKEMENNFVFSIKSFIEKDADRNADTDGVVEPIMADNGHALLILNQYSMTIEDSETCPHISRSLLEGVFVCRKLSVSGIFA